MYGGIEAGGTKFICGLGDEKGNVLEKVSFPTTTPEETMKQVIKYFKDKKIENLDIPIQKYTQISIIIISIILLIFQVPIFINLLTKYFGVIESFATELKINLISSTIIILISFIGIIFSDKL